jgi:hypothetical protein
MSRVSKSVMDGWDISQLQILVKPFKKKGHPIFSNYTIYWITRKDHKKEKVTNIPD